jgi:hypothetical protein
MMAKPACRRRGNSCGPPPCGAAHPAAQAHYEIEKNHGQIGVPDGHTTRGEYCRHAKSFNSAEYNQSPRSILSAVAATPGNALMMDD